MLREETLRVSGKRINIWGLGLLETLRVWLAFRWESDEMRINNCKKWEPALLIVIFLMLPVLLFGCGQAGGETLTPTTTPEPGATLSPTVTNTPTASSTPDVFEGVEGDIITFDGVLDGWRAAMDEDNRIERLVDIDGNEVPVINRGIVVHEGWVYTLVVEDEENDITTGFEAVPRDIFSYEGWMWRFDQNSQELVDLQLEGSGVVEGELGTTVLFEDGTVSGVVSTGGSLMEYSDGVLTIGEKTYEWVEGSWVEVEDNQLTMADGSVVMLGENGWPVEVVVNVRI